MTKFQIWNTAWAQGMFTLVSNENPAAVNCNVTLLLGKTLSQQGQEPTKIQPTYDTSKEMGPGE